MPQPRRGTRRGRERTASSGWGASWMKGTTRVPLKGFTKGSFKGLYMGSFKGL